MFQAQNNRETINRTLKDAVSFKIIMTTRVTRSSFTKRHQNCKTKTAVCKTKTKTDFFWSQTGLVLRPTVSDHITDFRVGVRVRWSRAILDDTERVLSDVCLT